MPNVDIIHTYCMSNLTMKEKSKESNGVGYNCECVNQNERHTHTHTDSHLLVSYGKDKIKGFEYARECE